MSDSGHTSYSMMHHCLSAVASSSALAGTAAHQGLSELLPSLPSPLALDDSGGAAPQTGDQALQVIATAQLLLSQLEANEASSPIPWEHAARVRHSLEELSSQVGAAVRRRRPARCAAFTSSSTRR